MSRALTVTVVAIAASACMPPAPPEQPRRLVEPGEFYWAQLECVAGAQLAVTTPQATNNNAAPNQPGQWMGMIDGQQDFRTQNPHYIENQRLSAMQQQYVEDCIRYKGYGWYLDRMRDLQDWLQYMR
ncbi:hypothetical protein [Halorhodospira halochloris]|uniref:hypothetical protein n=1 Tax=Halorhodospira halochloris TaxID=1052 RepID=UPI00190328E6|nr:hypothetical protein [Halorhodospira halochloris]